MIVLMTHLEYPIQGISDPDPSIPLHVAVPDDRKASQGLLHTGECLVNPVLSALPEPKEKSPGPSAEAPVSGNVREDNVAARASYPEGRGFGCEADHRRGQLHMGL